MKNIIAVDGPAGAGKSTTAKLAAQKLGYTYIDTGAMYRAVAYKTLQTGKEVTDELILETVKGLSAEFRYENGETRVFESGEEITGKIRTPDVNGIVSQVARLKEVRDKLVVLQRDMAKKGKVIMDGRDIGTNVLPNADLKIFLVADADERARRRCDELKAKGVAVDFEEIKKSILSRDKIDSEREFAPLKQAEDAILLDTTSMSIDEVVAKIVELAE